MSFQNFKSSSGTSNRAQINTPMLKSGGSSTQISWGGWLKPLIINPGTANVITIDDFYQSGSNSHSMQVTSSEDLRFQSTDGGTTASANTAVSAWAANDWIYFVARKIASANSKLEVLNSRTGQLFTGTDTTNSVSFSTADNLTIGYQGSVAGMGVCIAEFWCMMNKTFGGTVALDRALVEQLAYRGIFSIPHLAALVDLYVPFRENLKTYIGPAYGMSIQQQQNIWILNNQANGYDQPIWGVHPPLPPDYVDPWQTMRLCGPFG